MHKNEIDRENNQYAKKLKSLDEITEKSEFTENDAMRKRYAESDGYEGNQKKSKRNIG